MYSERLHSERHGLPNPHPGMGASGHASGDHLEAFVRGLVGDVLARHGTSAVSPAMLRPAQDFMDREWAQFRRQHPGPHLIFEGCAVSGLEANLAEGRLRFRWRTAFYPRPLHPSPEVDIYPLGCADGCDLYIAFQDGRGPLLVCRYGGGEKAVRWPVALCGEKPEGERVQALREALARTLRANALWEGDGAPDDLLGSPGMPWGKSACPQ